MTWERTEHFTSSNPHLSWLTKLEEMMEKKRTRAWRRHQARRVFKARLKYVGACQLGPRKLWHEIMNEKGVQCYRTTGTPCSCWLCKNKPFNRMAVKKEGKAIIKENLEWRWQIFSLIVLIFFAIALAPYIGAFFSGVIFVVSLVATAPAIHIFIGRDIKERDHPELYPKRWETILLWIIDR